MTCKEKLIADHPEWTEKQIAEYIKYACPSARGYLEDPDWCWDITDVTKCSRECWDREIPENIDAPYFDPNEVTKLDELAIEKGERRNELRV